MTELAEDLGLADATLDAIKTLTDTQKEAEAVIWKENSAAWRKLTDLLNEGLPSEEALLQASDEIGVSGKKIRNLKLSYTRKVRALLPTDQLENFMVRRKYLNVPRRR